MSTHYFSHTSSLTDEIDPILLDDLDTIHPRGIITFNNGYNETTLEDHEMSAFNTKSMILMLNRYGSSIFNPKTRTPLDLNQVERIKWYQECLDKFPLITHEDISDHKSIIDKWITKPLVSDIDTDMCKYFITYDQIIDYFGFIDINSREKAMEYFELNPTKTWVIRKSSITDTKYNQFFVIMYKKNGEYENSLFVHQQGYGIMGVNSKRGGNISTVSFYKHLYFTNIIELLNHCVRLQLICI
jgi:hypothetical protein